MTETFLHGVEVVEVNDGSRPITTVRSAVIGLVGTAPRADATAFPLNTPVLIAGSRTQAAKLLANAGDNDGTLPDAIDSIFDQAGALVVVIRVAEGTTENETLANVVGGVDANTGQYTGVSALLGAGSILGLTPRILIAPGFTHQQIGGGANPVVAELQGIAQRLRAIICADGPSTTDAAAVAATTAYAQSNAGRRVYLVDPHVKKLNAAGDVVIVPNSGAVAGLIARIDNELGFWWSPSNQVINGILGTERPIDFTFGDVNSRANILNEQNVATIIRQDGFRLWGNRTLSDDPKWQFLSVVRTADMINDSLMRSHQWAVDKNISKNYVTDVIDGVNSYLRSLTTIGAILGGSCWADPDLNTPESVAAGKVYFDFDFTPPAPAERITFRSHLVNDYIAEIF